MAYPGPLRRLRTPKGLGALIDARAKDDVCGFDETLPNDLLHLRFVVL